MVFSDFLNQGINANTLPTLQCYIFSAHTCTICTKYISLNNLDISWHILKLPPYNSELAGKLVYNKQLYSSLPIKLSWNTARMRTPHWRLFLRTEDKSKIQYETTVNQASMPTKMLLQPRSPIYCGDITYCTLWAYYI